MAATNSKRPGAKSRKTTKNQKIIITAILCFAVILLSFSGYAMYQLTYDKVYKGVSVEGVDVSGLTKKELAAKIPEIFEKPLSKTITLKIGETTHTFESLSLIPALDTETMTDEAFSYGRSKKFLARLGEISSVKKEKPSVEFKLCFDNTEVQKLIDTTTKDMDITAIPNKIEFETNALVITKGKAGNGVSFDEVKAAIEDCILGDGDVAEVEFKHIEPEEVTYDYIMRYVAEKPIDATYSVENHRIRFTESKPGVSLDKKSTEKTIKDSDGNTITIPAKIKQPAVTLESLKGKILADELGTYNTDYSSSSNDRASNIKLACSKINGYVLAPGDEFSYNDVVGPRTTEHGFKVANVYVGNTVQPGIGGGICQVSSTMYNSVIFADLEITERRNHTLPVSYVPMGRDATVSYGTTDFKFKNNTNYPVEIRAIAENGINTVTILGTDEHPDREIKIITSCTGTSSPKVIINKDPELLEGEVKVESSGSNGSSYVAYKVIYENGTEVSRTQLPSSTYRGKDRVEIHGTKKPEAVPEIVPENPASPTEPTTPPVPETEENPAE